MSTVYEIPLTANPQKLTISLGTNTYQLVVKWNDQSQTWVIDINDTDGNPVLTGLSMVTGADLLEQYSYMNFGGQLIAQSDTDLSLPPTFDNLGTIGHLYFVVN